MRITILIPHYKNGKTTAFAVSQYIKYAVDHDVKIVVIDNNDGDGSIEYLEPLKKHFILVPYPKDRLQSHGIAVDYAIELGYVDTEYFMMAESDSFPTGFYLDYYEALIKNVVDAAGSLLKLSGGQFLHPCAAIYKTSVWHEAKTYVNTIPYNYYPNFMMRDNFAVHTMIHKSLVEEIENNPSDWVELSSEYKGNTKQTMRDKLAHYSPVGCGVFHNGMGGRQESLRTYGLRTIELERNFVVLNGKNQKIIGRMGLEPAQFLSYWLEATSKKVTYIPTKTFWLPGKKNQQQEYTINEAGIVHIWAGSSYLDMKGGEMNDVYEFKKNQIEELYNSLPEHQKI